jgi:hypothetical protein
MAMGNCQRITLYKPIFNIIPDSIVPTAGVLVLWLANYEKELKEF